MKASKWWISPQASVVDVVIIHWKYAAACSPCSRGGSVSGVHCVRWHSRLADQQHVALRRRSGQRQEEGVAVTSKSALLSWSASLCNSHIIIRGRPRPAAFQPLSVWSCLLWRSASGVGWKRALSHCLVDNLDHALHDSICTEGMALLL